MRYDNGVIIDVTFTDYALMRMRQRDILEEEVHKAVLSPPSNHKTRRDERHEVRARAGAKVLLVIYLVKGRNRVVLNAMWEN